MPKVEKFWKKISKSAIFEVKKLNFAENGKICTICAKKPQNMRKNMQICNMRKNGEICKNMQNKMQPRSFKPSGKCFFRAYLNVLISGKKYAFA